MHTHKFSIPQLFYFGYKKAVDHLVFLIQVVVILLVGSLLTKWSGILSSIFSLCATISLTTVVLMIVRGHKPVLADLFKKYNNYKIFLHYILASIIFGAVIGLIFMPVLLSVAGMMGGHFSPFTVLLSPLTLVLAILSIAGIYVVVRLQFYKFFIIDKGETALRALSHSWKLTKKGTLHFFLYALAALVLNAIGAALFMVGLLVTVPITALATAKLYDSLTEEHKEA
jgi:uncharacterized membrane protein